jgi:hypothetical protein
MNEKYVARKVKEARALVEEARKDAAAYEALFGLISHEHLR